MVDGWLVGDAWFDERLAYWVIIQCSMWMGGIEGCMKLCYVCTHTPIFLVRSLQEVGRLDPPKQQGNYDAGQVGSRFAVSVHLLIVFLQFFLHKVFAYRGVVLFPWAARLFDRDLERKQDQSPPGDEDK